MSLARKTLNYWIMICLALSLNLPLQAQGEYVTTKWAERKKLENGGWRFGYGEQIRASDYLQCSASVVASIVSGNPGPTAEWLRRFISNQVSTLIDSAKDQGMSLSRDLVAQAIKGQGQRFQITNLGKNVEVDIGLATYHNKQVIGGIDFKQPNEHQIYFRYRFNVGPHSPGANPNYEVFITTGDVDKADSNARVYIALIGDRGQTDDIYINPPGDSWERGQTDTQRLDIPDVGELRRIRVSHNNGNKDPGWFVSTVIVRNLKTGRTWEFPCNCWLADSHNTHAIIRPAGIPPFRGHGKEGNVVLR